MVTKKMMNVLSVWGLVFIFTVSGPAMVQQEETTGPTVLKFSNVVYSPEKDGLLGMNIRLERSNETLTGEVTLYEGGPGQTYSLQGTMTGGRVRFSVRAGATTLRFRGHIEDGTLTGTVTTRHADGSEESSDVKARRLYR